MGQAEQGCFSLAADLWPGGQHGADGRILPGLPAPPSRADLFSSYLGADRKQRVSQFQPHPALGATAKAFMFWTCACLLGFAPRQPTPINQTWSAWCVPAGKGAGVGFKAAETRPQRGLFHRGLSRLLTKCAGDAMPRRSGLRGQCHVFDREQSSLQIPGSKEKRTHTKPKLCCRT